MSNRLFFLTGLATALIIAIFLSPFASTHPDGLNRVSEDLKFSEKEQPDAPATQLPFAHLFAGYALKGVPEGVATPLAGLFGTLATFGVAWGIGQLAVRRSASSDSSHDSLE